MAESLGHKPHIKTLIGVDCATDDRRTGLARAAWDGNRPVVRQVSLGSRDQPIVETLACWLQEDGPALLALDAPLGWPADLGASLHPHRAGEPLPARPDRLFRRHTDRVIQMYAGRLPLEVGADRIARTAHAALRLLEALRERTGWDLPLAWDPASLAQPAAIEVYPAATLKACGLPASGYKKPGNTETRRAMLTALAGHLHLPADCRLPVASADALDALVCVLAGADFLRGAARPPDDHERARKEGWIWARGFSDK